jgi:hypothetical protein
MENPKCSLCLYNYKTDFKTNIKIDNKMYCDIHAKYIIENIKDKNVLKNTYIIKLLEQMNINDKDRYI